MKNTLNISLPAAFLFILFIMNFLDCTGVRQNNDKRKSEVITIDLKKVRDGEYTGNYNVNINSARVFVSVRDGVIQRIEIIKHNHGPGYGADKITEEIMKKQTLHVDCVTGATKSSYVLKKAVENALKHGLWYRRKIKNWKTKRKLKDMASVNINGIKLNYEVAGKGKSVVICIHGVMGSCR